jgi:hypothetical protein
MSTTTAKPAPTPIPLQLSNTEFHACIVPCLSMPKRGPQCTLGYYRVFNLILWGLDTGMPWKGVPVPKDAHGQPAIHETNVSRAFATWADEGSLQRAFIARVGHLADAKTLDVRVLHGDGTKTVAQKGGMALAMRATSTRKGSKSSPSPTPRATCYLPSPSHPSIRQPWSCCPRG